MKKKALNQHDILNLWEFYSGHAVATDRRYSELISITEPLIRCIGEMDPTGQTFRYSYSTDAQKHLTDVSLINVLVLREQLRLIRENLEKLTNLTDYLLTEYRTGTFTRQLNREDLMNISKQLPPHHTWAIEATGFAGIKDSLQTTYVIGRAELSKAIRKIMTCRDMSRLIGIPVNVPGLTTADLIMLHDCWKLGWDRDVLATLRENEDGRADGVVQPVLILQVIDTDIQARKDPQASLAAFRQWATLEKLAGLHL